MDPRVRCHGMKANPTGYLWSKYECFLMSGCQDMDLSKTLKWRDGNANANTNANANADAKVSTIALPVLCTGELKTKSANKSLYPFRTLLHNTIENSELCH